LHNTDFDDNPLYAYRRAQQEDPPKCLPPVSVVSAAQATESVATYSQFLPVYVKGKHLSYQRGKRNTNPNTSLLQIEGVDDPKSAQ
jgi:hypothetical protein